MRGKDLVVNGQTILRYVVVALAALRLRLSRLDCSIGAGHNVSVTLPFLGRSIFLIGACLLPLLSSQTAADASPLQGRTSIFFSNMAVSYPLLAGIVAEEKENSVLFLDTESGIRREASLKDVSFTSVQGIPGEPGKFLLSAKVKGKSHIYTYDYTLDIFELEMAYDGVLIHPFKLGSSICALVPDILTGKGMYDFSARCSGGGLLPRFGNNRIVIGSDYALGQSEISFVYSYDGHYLDRIVKVDEFIELKRYKLYVRFTPVIFYMDNTLYYLDQCNLCVTRVEKLSNDRFVGVDLESMPIIKKISDANPDQVMYVDRDRFVYAVVNYNKGIITIYNSSLTSDSRKQFMVNLLP